MKKLLNYTTEVSATRTIGEIQLVLAEHKASAILTEYDDNGRVQAISFKIRTPAGEIPFVLPVNVDAVYNLLLQQRVRSVTGKQAQELVYKQAERVAWRILKDWVEAQMAIIDTQMVTITQVFMPYMLVDGHLTLYDHMAKNNFLLPAGH
ncbi:hypothetical protein [Dehalococcoides mccartyi]|uniref:hypothetical protein n=1 Tax=Dehalococcoides mccartyi TaxID=61435 RepID=UPI0026EA4DCA|nr:hypothetical protein [Dehalococcoides mccartyi]